MAGALHNSHLIPTALPTLLQTYHGPLILESVIARRPVSSIPGSECVERRKPHQAEAGVGRDKDGRPFGKVRKATLGVVGSTESELPGVQVDHDWEKRRRHIRVTLFGDVDCKAVGGRGVSRRQYYCTEQQRCVTRPGATCEFFFLVFR